MGFSISKREGSVRALVLGMETEVDCEAFPDCESFSDCDVELIGLLPRLSKSSAKDWD